MTPKYILPCHVVTSDYNAKMYGAECRVKFLFLQQLRIGLRA